MVWNPGKMGIFMGELLVYQRVHAVSFRATLNFLQKNHDFPFKMRYIKSHSNNNRCFFCFDPSPNGGSNFARQESISLSTSSTVLDFDGPPGFWQKTLPETKRIYTSSHTWRIIPLSKWLVTPIYKPFRPFVSGTTLLRGLTNHGY